MLTIFFVKVISVGFILKFLGADITRTWNHTTIQGGALTRKKNYNGISSESESNPAMCQFFYNNKVIIVYLRHVVKKNNVTVRIS